MKTHTSIVFIAFLCLITLCFISCASVRENEHEDVHLQETKTFEDFTFDQVWETAIRSVAEIDFIVQKRLVKSGFIYAQGKEDSDSLYLPPHMNIYIRQEYSKISVRCHVAIPGNNTDYEFSSGYVDLFFAALHKNLFELRAMQEGGLCHACTNSQVSNKD